MFDVNIKSELILFTGFRGSSQITFGIIDDYKNALVGRIAC